jgi:hypothetical protein
MPQTRLYDKFLSSLRSFLITSVILLGISSLDVQAQTGSFVIASPGATTSPKDLRSANTFVGSTLTQFGQAYSTHAALVQAQVPVAYTQESATRIKKRNALVRSRLAAALKQVRTDIRSLLKGTNIRKRSGNLPANPFGDPLATLPLVGQGTALVAAQAQVAQMRSFVFKLLEVIKGTTAAGKLAAGIKKAVIAALKKDLSSLSSFAAKLDSRRYTPGSSAPWTPADALAAASQVYPGVMRQIQDGSEHQIEVGFTVPEGGSTVDVNFKMLTGVSRLRTLSTASYSLPAECNATGQVGAGGISFSGSMDHPECGSLNMQVDTRGRLHGTIGGFPSNSTPGALQLNQVKIEGLLRKNGKHEVTAHMLWSQNGVPGEYLNQLGFGDAAPETFLAVSAGVYKGALLTNKGRVFSVALKSSFYGASPVARQVEGIAEAIDVSCGLECYAVKRDGSLYSWSVTDYENMYPSTAQLVNGISGVKEVAAGRNGFVIALKTDGTVWSWGANELYQLGDGTTSDRMAPAQMAALGSNNRAIAAGENQGVVLKSDGSVVFWGTIAYTAYPTPTVLSITDKATQISAGSAYNVAQLESGRVYAWGHLLSGLVPEISAPIGITAGAELYFSPLFLKSDGTVWKVGFSMIDGSMQTPELVNGLSNITLLDAYNHGYYVRSDGSVLLQISSDTVPYQITGILTQ